MTYEDVDFYELGRKHAAKKPAKKPWWYISPNFLRGTGNRSSKPPSEPPKRSRHISTDTKREVYERDGGRCVECGNEYDLEFDHIIPHSKGGSNMVNNIQLLCFRCNRSKSDKIV